MLAAQTCQRSPQRSPDDDDAQRRKHRKSPSAASEDLKGNRDVIETSPPGDSLSRTPSSNTAPLFQSLSLSAPLALSRSFPSPFSLSSRGHASRLGGLLSLRSGRSPAHLETTCRRACDAQTHPTPLSSEKRAPDASSLRGLRADSTSPPSRRRSDASATYSRSSAHRRRSLDGRGHFALPPPAPRDAASVVHRTPSSRSLHVGAPLPLPPLFLCFSPPPLSRSLLATPRCLRSSFSEPTSSRSPLCLARSAHAPPLRLSVGSASTLFSLFLMLASPASARVEAALLPISSPTHEHKQKRTLRIRFAHRVTGSKGRDLTEKKRRGGLMRPNEEIFEHGTSNFQRNDTVAPLLFRDSASKRGDRRVRIATPRHLRRRDLFARSGARARARRDVVTSRPALAPSQGRVPLRDLRSDPVLGWVAISRLHGAIRVEELPQGRPDVRRPGAWQSARLTPGARLLAADARPCRRDLIVAGRAEVFLRFFLASRCSPSVTLRPSSAKRPPTRATRARVRPWSSLTAGATAASTREMHAARRLAL